MEQTSDIRILDIIERQKRCGLCFVGSKRHVETTETNTNVETCDMNKPDNYLMYWDANNLYGWAMPQLLPYTDLEISDVDLETVLKTPDAKHEGYILKADLHVPDDIHDERRKTHLE